MYSPWKNIELTVKGEQSVLACRLHYQDNKYKDAAKLTEHSFMIYASQTACTSNTCALNNKIKWQNKNI